MKATVDFAPALSVALAHALWQVTLLSAFAACCLSLLRKSSAKLRHAVGMAWLLSMLAAPLATFASRFASPGGMALGLADALPSWLHFESVVADLAGQNIALLTQLWLVGASAMLVYQIGGGWHLLRRIERQASLQLPLAWQQRFDALQSAMGISRMVLVRMAGNAASPFTARLIRPVIWLPLSLLTRLPADQVEALLAHELAHIRRLDWLWNGIQCVVESILFFHPGVWWLNRQIRLDREQACDDLAVAVCGDAIVLAEALAALQRERLASPCLVLAAHGGSLTRRVTHLLSAPSSRQAWCAPVFAVLMVCAGTVLAIQPASQVLFSQAWAVIPEPPAPPEIPAAPEPFAVIVPPDPPDPPAPPAPAAAPAPPAPPAPSAAPAPPAPPLAPTES
ncbi:MAG: hypothetical protein K0R43_281 [Pseudoduganella sp.]|nr:hypothetical protein [Pseudoduganella sp.]